MQSILHIRNAQRRGSSRPLLVDTARGPQLVKLRGAAQGTGPLAAELIVAVMAEALGLAVPARTLLTLAHDTPTDDREDELADLLAASVGTNLGFAWMPDARDATIAELEALASATRAAILWLDRLVLNPDRTEKNPNLLWSDKRVWLIDHGAALRFQYATTTPTADSARAIGTVVAPHRFEAIASDPAWPAWDEAFAEGLPRERIEAAVAAVPDDFLRRPRADYIAFLWDRLQAPRAFAHAGPSVIAASDQRGRPPEWLARTQNKRAPGISG